MGNINHFKLYDQGSDHSHGDYWYSVIGCPLGECFWKNWRIKQWAFKVEYQARERRRLRIVQDDKFWSFYRVKQWAIDIEEIDHDTKRKGEEKRKLSALMNAESSLGLEPAKAAPVDTVSVYARMATRYTEGRYELKATVPTVADSKREKGKAKPRKLSSAEKKTRKNRPSYSVEWYGWGGQRSFLLHNV